MQLRYYRSDKDRVDKVHLLWPDTQLLMPSNESWETTSGLIRQQLETKLAAIDALAIEAPAPVADVKESLVLKLTTGSCSYLCSCVVLLIFTSPSSNFFV